MGPGGGLPSKSEASESDSCSEKPNPSLRNLRFGNGGGVSIICNSSDRGFMKVAWMPQCPVKAVSVCSLVKILWIFVGNYK